MAFPTQSIDFESSSSQYAQISNASQTGLNFADDFTLEGWVKFESTTGGITYPLAFKRVGTGNQRQYGFFWADNALFQQAYTDGSTIAVNVNVSWTPSTGVWYHLANTKNGTSVKFYVNGVQQGTTQTGASANLFTTGTAPFELLSWHTGDNQYFDGRGVLWRAWSIERTQTEISDNMCTVLGATTGLEAEWTLDNTYADNSGNGNTLTPGNSPTFGADVPATCSVVEAGRDARKLSLINVG